MLIYHELEPVYNKDSKVLILGSIPSITSRQNKFYYMHKNNRFWPIMEELYNVTLPTIDMRKKFILDNSLALYDVCASCNIKSSSDASIKDVKVNDLSFILANSKIDTIFCLGKTAYNLYIKYLYSKTNITPIYLPSPSSANCSYSLDKLKSAYQKIKEATKN